MLRYSQIRTITLDNLADGLDDYVGLWQIPYFIRDFISSASESEQYRATLQVITYWIENDLLRPGSFFLNVEFVPGVTKGNWTLWGLSPEEEIKRIREIWHDPHYSPEPGDDIWFAITQEGEKYLAENKHLLP